MSKEIRDELLKQCTSGHPDSTHPTDSANFIRYAIQCAKEECSIDWVAIEESGVSPVQIQRLQTAYSWIRQTICLIIEEDIDLKG